MTISDDVERVEWAQLAALFERAPLGTRDPTLLRTQFENSAVRCFAYEHSALIGAGRALSDGVAWAVIFDLVVEPARQGQGIGKCLMREIIERANTRNVMLHAVPGKEAFYERLGFRRMPTAMGRFANPQWALDHGYIEHP